MSIPAPGRIAEMLRRSTVHVRSGRGQSCGSAVVIDGERVITNAHVVRGSDLVVESWEGQSVGASVSKIDRKRDLALLAVPRLRAPAAQLGDSDTLKPGTAVIAVGNPLGFLGAVSTGIVSGIGRVGPLSRGAWIFADIRLAPGNSGGPLADFYGQVIGINTMVVGGGPALAIPSRRVQSFLTLGGSQRSLGVVVRPVEVPSEGFGLLTLEIVTNGAAERASLLPGDLLMGANGKRFRDIDDLQEAIDKAPAGLLQLEFRRGGTSRLRQVAVQLAPERLTSAA